MVDDRRWLGVGIITALVLEPLIRSAIYAIWKWWAELRPSHPEASA